MKLSINNLPFNTRFAWLIELTKILLALIGIQLFRYFMYRIMVGLGSVSQLFEPAGDITNGLTMLLTGLGLWLMVRHSLGNPGFSKFTISSKGFIGMMAGLAIFVVMAGFNICMDPRQFIPTVLSCLIFPFFEEPIFRGWIWKRMSSVLPAKWNGISTILLTTLLFALWHLGYWDVVAIHVSSSTTTSGLIHIMLMKMVIASIIGLWAGFCRWKTGNLYGSILIHAFWNLLGR